MRSVGVVALVCAASCSDGSGATEGDSPSKARDAAPTAEPADAAMPSPVDVGGTDMSDLAVPDGVPPLSHAKVSDRRRRAARRLNVAGLRAYERRAYKEAIASYKQALRNDPGHLLARYNLSCAYNLDGEPEKGLALLAEFRRDGCDDCLARLARASEDADWHSMWEHPLFIEIVAVRASSAAGETSLWESKRCPAGRRLVGAEGKAMFCMRGAQRDGPSARWHPSGKLSEIGRYARGQREGSWKFFRTDGTLRASGTYRDGKRHGTWSEWHPDGVQAADGRYRDGLRVGRWSWFDDKGAIVKQETYSKGELISQETME